MTRLEMAQRLDAELCRAYGPDSETVAAWRTVAGIRVVRYSESQAPESTAQIARTMIPTEPIEAL